MYMKGKPTQWEIVARYLYSRKGEWIAGHDIVEHASSMIGGDYLIQDADTRAHDLAREGYYSSPNFKYYIEHRPPHRAGNPTRFAQFRCTGRAPKETYGLKDWTWGQPTVC